jgi:hypothetical protein
MVRKLAILNGFSGGGWGQLLLATCPWHTELDAKAIQCLF